MKKQLIKIDFIVLFLILCLVLFVIASVFLLRVNMVKKDTINYYVVDDLQATTPLDEGKTLFEAIQYFAKEIDVFPVDIWAENRSGPIGKSLLSYEWKVTPYYPAWSGIDDRFFHGKFRYELTFDNYIPLYNFKETACRVSKDDLFDCVARIEEATPKEKTLILTTIFLFEKSHRKKKYFSRQEVVDIVLPRYVIPYQLKLQEWRYLINIIESYKNSQTIAFPEISVHNDDLLKIYAQSMKNNFNDEECKKWNLYPNMLKRYANSDLILSLKKRFPKDFPKFILLWEFFSTSQDGAIASSGIGPVSGNSSATPKTLGDIATQLLMSRISYEGKNE
jgi:hypothetical protein